MNRDYLTAQSVTSFGQEEIQEPKIVVVLPAYNAARTLRIICEELKAHPFANLMILVDDANRDETVAIAKAMNQVKVHICERNLKAYLFTLVMVFFDPRSKEQKDVS
jgi:cellulose synthase/poly-beta-1,6-N-acetylglucosamine synthase-like glycosyltransferase